ncbi:MAG: lipopolysaccharide transport system permease protein [Acidimicrobiaceae bacterium]|jgi:ABC-type polysaccharide/polyol phosphate export permease
MAGRDLFVTLVERQLRLRAKRTWVGTVWPLVAPFLLLALYIFVFHSVFKVPVAHYGTFLFAGLLPWTLLAQGLGASVTSISNEAELVRRAPFPYELLPITTVVSLALPFIVGLIGFLIYLQVVGRLDVVLVPLLVVPVAAVVLFVMSLSMILALIDVHNRALRSVLANLLTVWFFLVPVVYSPDMVHARLRALRSIDPMNMIVGQFRDLLYYRHVSRPLHMGLMVAVCVAFFGVCLMVFRGFAADLPRDV